MKLMQTVWLIAAVTGCATGRAGLLPGEGPVEIELEVELAAARYIKIEFGDTQLAFDGRHAPYGAPPRGLRVPTGPRSPQALGRILAELGAVAFPASGVSLCPGAQIPGCVGSVVIMEAPAISGDTADIWVYVYSETTPSPEIGEFWWRFVKRGDAWEYHSALSQRIIMLQPPSLGDQASSQSTAEPSPLLIAVETVLRGRVPGDPDWVVVRQESTPSLPSRADICWYELGRNWQGMWYHLRLLPRYCGSGPRPGVVGDRRD